jgi:hypothetical protein
MNIKFILNWIRVVIGQWWCSQCEYIYSSAAEAAEVYDKGVLRYKGEGTYKLKRLVLRDSSKCLNKKEKMCSTCKWIIAKRVTRSCLYWLGGSNRPRLWSGVRCRWQLISWMMIQRSREKETYVNCCGGAHWMSLGLACWMNFVRNRRKWILWIQWFFL